MRNSAQFNTKCIEKYGRHCREYDVLILGVKRLTLVLPEAITMYLLPIISIHYPANR